MNAQELLGLQEAYLGLYGKVLEEGSLKMMRRQDSEQHESYDLIISHLLDEGYANTPEEAQVILDNMSEGWKTDILKKAVNTTGKAAKYVSKKGWKAAKPTVKKYVKKAGRFALMTALGLPF